MPIESPLPAVLVVDDNAEDLFVLRQRLQRSGIPNPIVAFTEGAEAMAHLKRVIADREMPMPALMLLDLRMPRCGGFEVLRWVRAQPALTGLRVVIVSNSVLPEDAARAAKLGATRFIAKFPSPEFLAEIMRDPPVPSRN